MARAGLPETFIALGDGLALSNVAADNCAGKRSSQARLVNLDLQPVDFRLAGLGHGFPSVHIVLRGFGLEIGGFEICVAREPGRAECFWRSSAAPLAFISACLYPTLFCATCRSSWAFTISNCKRPVVQLTQNIAGLDGASFVFHDGHDQAVGLGSHIDLMLYGKNPENVTRAGFGDREASAVWCPREARELPGCAAEAAAYQRNQPIPRNSRRSS